MTFGKRRIIFIFVGALLIFVLCIGELIAGSPILFTLNRNKVELFRALFSNALPTGNMRISGLESRSKFLLGSDTQLEALLWLSYIPNRTKLVLHHLKVIERTEHEISSKTLNSVELRGGDLLNILNKGVDENFFKRYFLARNTPRNEEIPIIKEALKTYIKQKLQGVDMIDMSIEPADTGTANHVAYDKLYMVTVKLKRKGQLATWSGYFGNSNNIWIVPPMDELEQIDFVGKGNT